MNNLLLLYLALVVIHVSCRDLGLAIPSKVTKVVLMPSLLWYYLSTVGAYSTESTLVVLALVMGTLGDFFLLLPEKPLFFGLGAGAFLIGHLFYIALFAHFMTTPAYMILVAVLAIYPLFRIFKMLKASPLPIPLFCYAIVLSLVAVFAAGAGAWVSLLGVLFFILSDGMLGLNTIKRTYSDVAIMLTYTLAQLFLIVGILRLQGVGF